MKEIPARIGPCELAMRGSVVSVCCPADHAPLMERADAMWEPGSRPRLIQPRRIGPVRAPGTAPGDRPTVPPRWPPSGPAIGRRAQHANVANARATIRTDLAAFGSFVGQSAGRGSGGHLSFDLAAVPEPGGGPFFRSPRPHAGAPCRHGVDEQRPQQSRSRISGRCARQIKRSR